MAYLNVRAFAWGCHCAGGWSLPVHPSSVNCVNVHGNVTGLGAKEALATLEGWPS